MSRRTICIVCALLGLALLAAPGCKNGGSTGKAKHPATGGATSGSGSNSGTGTGSTSGPSAQWQVAMAALAAANGPEDLTLDGPALDRFNQGLADAWPRMHDNVLTLMDAQLQGMVGQQQGTITLDAISVQSGLLHAPPRLLALSGSATGLTLELPGAAHSWSVTALARVTFSTTFQLGGAPVTVSDTVDLEVTVSDLQVRVEAALDAQDPTLPLLSWVGQPQATTFSVAVRSTHALAGPVLSFLTPAVEVIARAAVDTVLQEARRQLLDLAAQPGPLLGTGGPAWTPLGTPPADLEALADEVGVATVRDNLNFGLISEVVLSDPLYGQGTVADLRGVGDSAIWTGSYLASLAYRYSETGDPTAEALADEVLDGVTRLLDVSAPYDGLIGRTALPLSSPLAQRYLTESRHYVTQIGGQDWISLGNISRDQNLGVMCGLGQVVYRMPNQAARARVLLGRMLRYLTDHDWNAYDYNTQQLSAPFAQTPAVILSFLQAGRMADPGTWQGEFDEWAPVASLLWLPTWSSTLTVPEQYYKFNLAHTTFVNLLEFETDPVRYREYLKAMRLLRRTLAHHGNAWFDSVYAMAVPTEQAQITPVIEESLQRWAARPRRGFQVQNSQDPSVPQATYIHVMDQGRTEQMAAHPLPVEKRKYADFLWQRSPFGLDGNRDPHDQGSGVDLLLPYWFGRAHGLR